MDLVIQFLFTISPYFLGINIIFYILVHPSIDKWFNKSDAVISKIFPVTVESNKDRDYVEKIFVVK